MKNKPILIVLLLLIVQAFTPSCHSSYHQKKYMRKTYKKIRKKVKEAKVTKYNDTVKVSFPTNILFDKESYIISETVLPSIVRFAAALNKYDKTAILVSGFTDSLGTEEYNNNLSMMRAEMAKKTLVNNEVLPERINTWGMGERHPIASNETEAGRAKNRRVEFVILYKEEKKK